MADELNGRFERWRISTLRAQFLLVFVSGVLVRPSWLAWVQLALLILLIYVTTTAAPDSTRVTRRIAFLAITWNSAGAIAIPAIEARAFLLRLQAGDPDPGLDWLASLMLAAITLTITFSLMRARSLWKVSWPEERPTSGSFIGLLLRRLADAALRIGLGAAIAAILAVGASRLTGLEDVEFAVIGGLLYAYLFLPREAVQLLTQVRVDAFTAHYMTPSLIVASVGLILGIYSAETWQALMRTPWLVSLALLLIGYLALFRSALRARLVVFQKQGLPKAHTHAPARSVARGTILVSTGLLFASLCATASLVAPSTLREWVDVCGLESSNLTAQQIEDAVDRVVNPPPPEAPPQGSGAPATPIPPPRGSGVPLARYSERCTPPYLSLLGKFSGLISGLALLSASSAIRTPSPDGSRI